MLVANDLRVKIYLRSLTSLLGFDEVKRVIIEQMLDLEQELKRDPELMNPKKFDADPKELRRRNKAAKH